MIKYIIHGSPIPLARPRFYNGRVIDCQTGEKMVVATNLRFMHKDRDYYSGPLHFDIKFFMKHKKKQGYHSCRPDLDNMIKFYADICMGILYHDDSQIAKITAEKIYSNENRVEIIITELNENNTTTKTTSN